MIIKKSSRFNNELEFIVDFIASNNLAQALIFFKKLNEKIKSISSNPYSYRKRDSSDNINLRELIFKGYTIPFYIDKIEDKIVILGIFNQNIWED